VKTLLTKAIVSLSSVLIFINPQSVLAVDFDFGFKAGFESFEWEEFGENGESLLTETGTRFVAGAFIGNTPQLKKQFIYNAEIKNYFGVVDYDGQTQPDDGSEPVKTDTTYTGFNLSGEAGIRAPITNGSFAWDFTGKLDIDTWIRNLASSTTESGRPTAEGQEQYFVLNLRIGTGPAWHSGKWQGRVIIGVKQPIYTYEFVDNYYTGFTEDVVLHPKGQTSGFLTFNNDIQLSKTLHLKIDAYYDSYRFDRSDPKFVTEVGTGDSGFVVQPKSSQDTYGIVAGLGWKF